MIRNWDDDGCVFAVLPACLKNGSNPSTFSNQLFPLYYGNGLAAPYFRIPKTDPVLGSLMGKLVGGMQYNNGSMECDGISGLLYSDVYTNTNLTDFSIIYWFRYDKSICNQTQEYRTIIGNTLGRLSAGKKEEPINIVLQQGNGVFDDHFLRHSIYESNYVSLSAINTFTAATKISDARFNWDEGSQWMFAFTFSPQSLVSYWKNNVAVSGDSIGNAQGTTVKASYAGTPAVWGDYRIPFIIGSNFNTSYEHERFFFGNIDGLLLYNRKLTQQEVTDIYNLGPDLGGLRLIDNEDGSGYFDMLSSGEYENKSEGFIPSSGDDISINGSVNNFSNPDEDRFVI